MKRKLRVAILFGGKSAEHEISVISARNIVQAMDKRKYQIVSIGIDKQGRWFFDEGARLLQNQTDIGNAVKPFYGEAAGTELTRQLRLHIQIAAEVIAAAQAGDQAKLADAQARWQSNADDIAGVLASVNPRFWKLETMKAEMQTHLELTTDEVVARLQANWDDDVVAYDRVHEHILHMADLLSNGIVKQFPKRFH